MSTQNKRTLVLSGGSLKGAFQVGAIKAAIESGFRPDSIYGISVGSLNGLFIANEAGKQNVPFEQLDWTVIVDKLVYFWINNIRQSSDIVRKKSKFRLTYETVFGRFNGLVDTTPLHSLVRRNIDMANLYRSPVSLKVGVVNIADGNIVYANPSYPNFIDYVLASTAIPIIMPVVNIGRNPCKAFLDGSMRDVAPLRQAFESGSEEIICIACQARNLFGATFNYGNVVNMADRILDILLNEGVNTDIERMLYINYFLPSDGSTLEDGPFVGYKKIKLKVIRPPVPINIEMLSFNSDDIQNLIQTGYHITKEKLKNGEFKSC